MSRTATNETLQPINETVQKARINVEEAYRVLISSIVNEDEKKVGVWVSVSGRWIKSNSLDDAICYLTGHEEIDENSTYQFSPLEAEKLGLISKA